MSSVEQLVATFRLRRRADSHTYARGITLAEHGAVSLLGITGLLVQAVVDDGDRQKVQLRSHDSEIEATCTCEPRQGVVCAHEVAAAHALWTKSRRELAR